MKQPFKLIEYITYVFITSYSFCMLIFPWLPNFCWSDVQEVWMSWQSLNVGVLAYISTFFIYKAAKHSEDIKRKRNFKAEKAFLPNALSELQRYLKDCYIYLDSLESIRREINYTDEKSALSLPNLPIEHKEVFRQCIMTADDDVANYMSGILMRLQIFNSRIKASDEYFKNQEILLQDETNITIRKCSLIEIYTLADKLYDFARDVGTFDNKKIRKSEIINAIRSIDVDPNQESELIERTKEYIARGGIMKKSGKSIE